MNRGLWSWFILAFFWGPAFGQSAGLQEEIYTCSNDSGLVTTRVFLDPTVYCKDDRSNDATLIRESDHGSTLFKGKLIQRKNDDSAADFVFTQLIDNIQFQILLTLPQPQGQGTFLSKYDDVLEHEETLDCVMRLVHVECE